MRRLKPVPGGYYHLYNRGESGVRIFFNKESWYFFLSRLKRYFTNEKVDILAYCLMPNHYHLLVRIHTEDFGNKVMRPFTVSYSRVINKQQYRNGHVFQRPFQLRQITNDGDLLNLSRYIHNNPVVCGLVAKPADWEFSSYQDYLGMRKGDIPKTDLILSFFPGKIAYQEFVESENEIGVPANLLFD